MRRGASVSWVRRSAISVASWRREETVSPPSPSPRATAVRLDCCLGEWACSCLSELPVMISGVTAISSTTVSRSTAKVCGDREGGGESSLVHCRSAGPTDQPVLGWQREQSTNLCEGEVVGSAGCRAGPAHRNICPHPHHPPGAPSPRARQGSLPAAPDHSSEQECGWWSLPRRE